MKYDINQLADYILNKLQKLNLKHKVNSFPSGAYMIDIWKNNDFFVIQLESERMGISIIDDDTGFTTVPDAIFGEVSTFKKFFEAIVVK